MSVQRIRPASAADNAAKDSMTSLNAWKNVLDEMEQRLESGERFIASMQAATQQVQDDEEQSELSSEELSGEYDTPDLSFTPPVDIGPVPAELVDRARQVLQRQHDLEAATQAAMNTARKHSDAAKAMRPAAPSVPVYFDGSL